MNSRLNFEFSACAGEFDTYRSVSVNMYCSSFPVGCVSSVLGTSPEQTLIVRARLGRVAKVHFPQRCEARASSTTENESEQCQEFGCGEAKCGRRDVGIASLAFLLACSSNQWDALAGGLDKYFKRKKLDPLDTYVPTVLLAQSQFQEVDGKLGGEEKTYADARSLLRSGPAASLRTDIRAVAQYAAETGNNDGASAVDQCLSALEDLDSLLLQASRSQGAPVERMRKDLTETVAALDRLLATVPAPILEKAKVIAQAYKEDGF